MAGDTSGPGGVGALPSSRLTRILQEKAEALKRQRQAAEALLKQVDEETSLLEHLGITPPDVAEPLQTLKDLQRRSDWESAERQARILIDRLAEAVPHTLEARRQATLSVFGQLSGLGIPVPPTVKSELDSLAHPPPEEGWATTVGRLVRVEDALRKAEVDHVAAAQRRAHEVAQWAGLSPDRMAEVEGQLDLAAEPAKEGRPAESLEAIGRVLREGIPEAAARRQKARDTAAELVQHAKEEGASTAGLESLLETGTEDAAETWPDSVARTEAATRELAEALRDRATQSLEGLRSSLGATAEYGADPNEARRAIEDALARLPAAAPLDIHPISVEARRVGEEPVVSVIAGLLDEVRPRIAEARRLGRDPSEVFASMNRAREALRLRIYSEAFAASQEALDRVSRLTADLDTARDELQALEEMLARFRAAGFSTEGFDPPVARIRTHLERAEVGPARELLKDTFVRTGKDALQYFVSRWGALEKVREFARGHEFLTPETDQALTDARERLDRGDLADGAERTSRVEVTLRTAALPYVAHRVEEMERGLADIPDDALTAPVRRLLADVDVALRVKEDVITSIESLRRAERDFAAVFAAHASALVEVLEAEVNVLQQMGGPSDEVQRQIDEVQQIFNMGDFVKASRASQEIRTRAQQQQLLRSDEAVSHAKLSLVELETMGLDLTTFRAQLDEAQAAARANQYLDAYRVASRLEESAGRARAAGQAILDGIAQANERLNRLREAGLDPSPYYELIRAARLEFQSLRFDAAQATIEGVGQRLDEEEARLETTRLSHEVELLIEDGHRLSVPMEPFVAQLDRLKTERATAPAAATRTGTRLLHEELVAILRPVLEENLRSLERDLDVARGAGVDLEKIMVPLSEARRRIGLPVPVGAATLLDAGRGEFVQSRGLVEHAERIAKRAREALATADLLHADSVPHRAQMDQVEQLLTQKQFARVIELGGPLERELLQATYQHVSKALAGFQAVVTRTRQAGIDASLAENLLHQARTALDEGRSMEALQLASRSESELERAELQRRIAEGSLNSAAASLAKATSAGILATTANDAFESAKSSFQQHAYPAVLERSMEALDALATAREGHRRAQDALATAEQQAVEAAQNGANSTEATDRISEARQYIEVGKYSDAIRAAREATEQGRWAIERMYAAPLGELRREIEAARRQGLTTEVDPLEAIIGEGEVALRSRDWPRVRDAVERGNHLSRAVVDEVIDGRWRTIEAEYAQIANPSLAEVTRRMRVREELADCRERRDFGSALDLLKAESELARRQRKEILERRFGDFKDRLWVGERLGVDTTPMMQKFSEARVAMDATRLEDAEVLLGRAASALEPVIREPFVRRLKELQAEVMFAEEGLHVSVGPVRAQVREIEELDRGGRLLEAAHLLLKEEEELSLRKSLHRELMNLHYLIDAALARASERRLDTTEARALLTESIRLREADYAEALEKAREALRRLHELGAVKAEPAAAPPIWPFRRPPAER